MKENQYDLAALILRVCLGTMFIAHGYLKLSVFTMAGTAQFFEQVGFASWMAYPVTFFELIGGVLLVVGLFSRQVAILSIPVLIGAIAVHWGNGWLFTANNGGWEYPMFLAFSAVAVAMLGDGRYALINIVRRNQQLA